MSKIHFLFFTFLLFLFTNCKSDKSEKNFINRTDLLQGKVIGIFDGDTYNILMIDNQTIKVRMEGIDAPERDMPFHKASQKYLSQLIFKKEIKLYKTGEDQYGRTLGFTYLLDGTDVNLLMLQAGMVWHYKIYNSNRNYSDAEKVARSFNKGLWIDKKPVAPWEFRKNRRRSN